MSAFNTSNGFNCLKAAQIAAWFALKEDGQINRLKLMKLMYLAERESISRYDMPMLLDKYVSMKHGPVLSQTYDLAKGEQQNENWDSWIRSVGGYQLGCVFEGTPNFDALSKADINVLQAVWDEYGHLDRFELAKKTHEESICPEWEDPGDSAFPIPLKRILHLMNKEKSDELADEIEAYRNLSETLNRPT